MWDWHEVYPTSSNQHEFFQHPRYFCYKPSKGWFNSDILYQKTNHADESNLLLGSRLPRGWYRMNTWNCFWLWLWLWLWLWWLLLLLLLLLWWWWWWLLLWLWLWLYSLYCLFYYLTPLCILSPCPKGWMRMQSARMLGFWRELQSIHPCEWIKRKGPIKQGSRRCALFAYFDQWSNPYCTLVIWDFRTQLYRDYKKAIIRIPMNQSVQVNIMRFSTLLILWMNKTRFSLIQAESYPSANNWTKRNKYTCSSWC